MARWLLLVYQLPTEPSAPRVAVWRALKRLPGNYIQDGVFVVRFSRFHAVELENLAHDVRNYGGKAVLLETSRVDGEEVLDTLTGTPKHGQPKRSSGDTPSSRRRVRAHVRTGRRRAPRPAKRKM